MNDRTATDQTTMNISRPEPRIAVCVPCYNEGVTIGQVVEDFRAALPQARIIVFDNNSNDDTAARAREHGAMVISVARQGKGYVVRHAFADVEADVYLLVDGDGTYEADAAPAMIKELLERRLDMMVGCRIEAHDKGGEAYRPGHRLGNRLLTELLAGLFGGGFSDVLSGYRVLSRRFVKSFPARAQGFETETELTVHALELRMPCGEMATRYGARPEGSQSKLSTYRDGWRILRMMIRLLASQRPLLFFSVAAGFLALIALALFAPVGLEYLETGLVRRLPTAVLSSVLMLSSMLSLVCGVVLDQVTRARYETKWLRYLAVSSWQPERVMP